MSAKVKQANFRLPIEYVNLIDEISNRENITKAVVITRALDCLKASFESGSGGFPATGAKSAAADTGEIEALRAELKREEKRADEAEKRARDAAAERDSAEAKARSAESRAADAEARATASAKSSTQSFAAEEEIARYRALVQSREASIEEQNRKIASKDEELIRLRTLVAKHEASLEEKKNVYASRETEIATKNAAIAERDARIASLSEQLGAANARIELAKTANEVKAVMVGDSPLPEDEETTRALYMFNMLGGVMGAFQQQVADARIVGEQEGRSAVQRELQDTLEKARNDGYRDAMTYLDDRVTTARENGAREERARIANMSIFERRRYLRMHIA